MTNTAGTRRSPLLSDEGWHFVRNKRNDGMVIPRQCVKKCWSVFKALPNCYFCITLSGVMRVIFLFLVMVASLTVSSQKPEFRFTMEGIGDNREFHNGQSRSQTILGSLGSALAGMTFDGHSLFAGISHLLEFGSSIDFHQPKLVLYYGYEDPIKAFRFGSFPRRGTVDFPLAMLADTLLYYRPLIEGMSGKLSGDWGHQLAFVDWTGRQTGTVRESFMAGTSGEIAVKKWFLQNYVLLNHLAHPALKIAGQHIKDYFGYALLTGFRSGQDQPFRTEIKGGLLSSLFRERSVTGGFQASYGLYLEGIGSYRNYGLKATWFGGDPLQFAHGDPLYRFKNYIRADALWYFVNHKNVKGRFNWSFHAVSGRIDQSQQLSLIVIL